MATKQTAKNFTQDRDRDVFSIPADWARMGSHEDVDEETETRYHAEKVLVENELQGEVVSPQEIDYHEDVLMWVCYRNPESDDRVEVAYRAAAIEGEDGELTYIPKVVRRGGPDKFKSSIAVPKRRVGEGR